MNLPKSLLDAPRAIRERISRSMETEESPVSIFATRDWLDLNSLATSTWVSRFCRRSSFIFLLRASFISRQAVSSAVSPRNASTVPTFQPFASRRLLLAFSIYILHDLRRQCMSMLTYYQVYRWVRTEPRIVRKAWIDRFLPQGPQNPPRGSGCDAVRVLLPAL